MSDLSDKLKAAAEFDEIKESKLEGYEIFRQEGAKNENARLTPLIHAMAEAIALQDEAIDQALRQWEHYMTERDQDDLANIDHVEAAMLRDYKQARAAARERLKGWVE